MTRQTFWHRIKHYATLAGIDSEKLSPHVLRLRDSTTSRNHFLWIASDSVEDGEWRELRRIITTPLPQ